MKNGKVVAIMFLLIFGGQMLIAGQNYQLSLDAVSRGALPGDYATQEYASKVRDIMNYNYKQAPGKADLKSRLQSQLADYNTTQDIVKFKKAINLLHAMLQTYPQAAAAPAYAQQDQPITVDSILAGSLGSDYAEKCKRIMTNTERAAMLQNYVDSWQKSNGTLDFKKTMIKRNIDNLYHIAQKY